MNRLDLIIAALERKEGFYNKYELENALEAARELKELKPVGYMDKEGLLFNDTTHPHLHTPLYALEVTK